MLPQIALATLEKTGTAVGNWQKGCFGLQCEDSRLAELYTPAMWNILMKFQWLDEQQDWEIEVLLLGKEILQIWKQKSKWSLYSD